MNKVIFPLIQDDGMPEVGNLQDALLLLLNRGFILANDEGTWRKLAVALKRERIERTYGDATSRLVSIFQEERRLDVNGSVDEPTANAINGILRELGLLSRPKDERRFVVRGRVVNHELRGLAGLSVAAVDKNVGREMPLGEGTTGDRGTYEIHYTTKRLRQGKELPDIQVHAISEDNNLLAVSAVRYTANPEENGLDIVIPAEKLPRLAEYHRLVSELGTHLDTQDEPQLKKRLATLREDDEQQDITYLANKTGWDARMVAMTTLASQFSERSGVEPEFYYALFRAGVPANEAVLSQMAPQTVRQAWERAVEQEILPAELKEKIPASLERFKVGSIRHLLEGPAQIGLSSFNELLAGGLDDAADQLRFTQLYYEQRGDLNNFWETVRDEFPKAVYRLQMNGQLGFLTINNAPLIQRLHGKNNNLRSPVDLIHQGLYRSEAWKELLGDDIAIPDEIPGERPDEKRANYAEFMASQLRLSYPTAIVAEKVTADEIPLNAEQPVKQAVVEFLARHQGEFELGLQPVEQYLRKNDITLEGAVLAEVKKLQRVYQISPSDEAMSTLLGHGLDSASAVVRYDEQAFMNAFKGDLGGEALARLTYAKAHQVHHAIVNITTAYLLERSALLPYGLMVQALFEIDPEETGVLAYPTLEGLFGELDYCACEHCRSWLSPAAYLVDLLQFLGPQTGNDEGPLEVLLARRPDIQHLQLTCENTNVALPYIDVVNEVLEHFVVNGSLATFTGHDTGADVNTEELMARPQFVNDAAYTELRNSVFPSPLPFHQPLETLRRYFDHFKVPLHEAMERLRANDELERAGGLADSGYGWRDVLMERLQLSRPEHAVLTDSSTPLQTLYGENPNMITVEDLISNLRDTNDPEPRQIGISNVKLFARKLKLTYEELIEIIRTQFNNPHSYLIPKLEKLHVNFATIQSFLDGTLSETAFNALLPDDLDADAYGGDVHQWLREHEAEIMGLIVLSDPTGSEEICSFENVELRYARPDFDNNSLRPFEFLKLLRFIRLWRKLGWSIGLTDKAITALYPEEQRPAPDDPEDAAREKLDAGFQTLLVRLAHLQIVIEQLGLRVQRDLTAILACWSPIDTHGSRSLYRQMFLNPTILALDDVFEEDGHGNYLHDATRTVPDHADVLRAAFNLTQEEFDLISDELGFDEATVLNLENVSAIHRYGFLARALRFSVRELLALQALSGLNPFEPPDLTEPTGPAQPLGAVRPAALRFVELAQQLRKSPLKISQLLYFLQHVDLTGKASPSQEDVLAVARTLRSDLLRIDREHVVQDDPTGEIASAKMALVYGSETTDIFFGLLKDTSLFGVDYDHGQLSLEDNILDVTDRIAYDDFQKRLTFRGVMTPAERGNLEAAPSATDDFQQTVVALFEAGQDAFVAFFERYPELQSLYENFVDADSPLEDRMSALLAEFLPELRTKLKRQQVRQTLGSQLGADSTRMLLLLENASLLHAADQVGELASTDFLALEIQGLSIDIFYSDDVIGEADEADLLVSNIDYRPGGAVLPAHPLGGNAVISGVWSGFVEAPDSDFYNLYIEADLGAEIELLLGEAPVALTAADGVWRNQEALHLEAGQLYTLQLTARRVRDRLVLKWEHRGMGRIPIPAEQLYPAALLTRFTVTYLRILKALAVVDAFGLSAGEMEYFARHSDYAVDGEGWLNALPVSLSLDEVTTRALLESVLALVSYRELKGSLNVDDERLLEVLQDPAITAEDGAPLLNRVTGWQEGDLAALLDHFGLETGDLAHLPHFIRLREAFAVAKKLGVGADTLLSYTTNEPTGELLRGLQAALRARYDSSAWLKVIQPINDELRVRQRDALVASVLHRLSRNSGTAHIDTVDKLFEYFLIDVQMDACMPTSRIRLALSSVQSFVQRCLLNLEPQVEPDDIKAEQWEWMKRYRVWEVNRKLFLWPENWLEPELRDNKSPFFRDLESELLQGDITDDAAATALVHYLEKLDEVAKLEICGMYYEENDVNNEADDVVHVIARTPGARRTYYYRRQDGGIAWTPWERIDLAIEDNPVLPVVWNGRLFLFWVSVLQEGDLIPGESANNNDEISLGEAKPSELINAAGALKARIEINLHWSEYYHGYWHPERTSDINRPLDLGLFDASGEGAFDRSKLGFFDSRRRDTPKALFINITHPGTGSKHFTLHNTHSLPVLNDGLVSAASAYGAALPDVRSFSKRTPPFVISVDKYAQQSISTNSHRVLTAGALYDTIAPRHHPLETRADLVPFFFQDPHHVFYVKPVPPPLQLFLIPFGMQLVEFYEWVDPPVVVRPDLRLPREQFFYAQDPMKPGVIDSTLVEHFLRQDVRVYRGLGMAGTVQFGDRLIGPGGAIIVENGIR